MRLHTPTRAGSPPACTCMHTHMHLHAPIFDTCMDLHEPIRHLHTPARRRHMPACLLHTPACSYTHLHAPDSPPACAYMHTHPACACTRLHAPTCNTHTLACDDSPPACTCMLLRATDTPPTCTCTCMDPFAAATPRGCDRTASPPAPMRERRTPCGRSTRRRVQTAPVWGPRRC